MPIDPSAAVARYNRLKDQRVNFDSRWELMAPHIAPSRVGIISQRSMGEKQTQGVFDSTATMAADTFASFIAGRIINPSDRWLLYRMRNNAANRIDSIREWLDEVRDIALKEVDNSPFYAEAPEALVDYVGFGTGYILGEEQTQPVNTTKRGFRGFYFKAEKIGRYVLAEGPTGYVDTTMREFEYSARLIVERWPSGQIPAPVQNAINSGNPDKAFRVLHAIVPRPKVEQRQGALGMPWASAWIELESKTLIHESGYRIFPVATPRYRVSPNEPYGRGPGEIAYPDIVTLNTAKRMGFEDWALKIRPPVLYVSNTVYGTAKLIPGGSLQVNAHGRSLGDVIRPWETGSHPEVSQIKEEELRRSIREIFFVDTIRQLLQVEKSEMTAFEFAQKLNLLFRMVATAYGRLRHEFLTIVGEIVFDGLFHAGAFPPPPPEIEETDGIVDVEFENPIARAQRAGDAEATTLAFGDLLPFAQAGKVEVLDRFDPDGVSAMIFDVRGVPGRAARSDEAIAELRAARAEQMKKEQEMAEAGQIAEVTKNLAPLAKGATS